MPDYNQFHLDTGEFTPTYAGSPLDIVTDTNKALQERHYQNINDLTKTQIALANMSATLGDSSKGYLTDQAQTIHETLDEMAKSGAENSTAKVNMLTRKLLGDEKLIRGLRYAEDRKKDEALAAELHAKTGKKVLLGPDYHTFHQKSMDELQSPYKPSAAVELDVNEAMASVIDRVKDETWEAAGMGSADLAAFKKGDIKSKLNKIDGLLYGISKSGNKKQLEKLRDELQTAFKSTGAYKQQIEYNQDTHEGLVDKLDNYIQLSKHESEQMKAMEQPGYETWLGHKLAGLKVPPVNPYVAENTGGAYKVPGVDYRKAEENVSDLQTRIDNVNRGINPTTGKGFSSPEEKQKVLDALQSQKTVYEDQLSSGRKAIENNLNLHDMYLAYKKSLTSPQSASDKNKLDHIKEGYMADGKLVALPQTEEEFVQFVRAGKPVMHEYGPNENKQVRTPLRSSEMTDAAQKLADAVTTYTGAINKYKDQAQLVNNNKTFPVSKESHYNAWDVQEQYKKLITANTEFLDPLTGEQTSLQGVIDSLKDDDSVSDKDHFVTDDMITEVPSKPINGKFVIKVTPMLQNKDTGAKSPSGKSFYFAMKDQDSAKKLNAVFASDLTNHGNAKTANEMLGYSAIGETLQTSNLYYSKDRAFIGNVDGDQYFARPVAKDNEGKNNLFEVEDVRGETLKYKDANGNLVPIRVRNEEEVAAVMGQVVNHYK